MITLTGIEDAQLLRQTFGCFPSGVVALTAVIDGEPVGLAASSFTSVSLEPPLISVCIASTSTTWPRLRQAPRIGVSVLGEGHGSACRQLSSKTGDRFAGVDLEVTDEGAAFVDGATALFDCSIETEIPAGDHDVVLMRIHALHSDTDTSPLVFHGSKFRTLTA
ncbi:flavin reductase family protein [Rhodococcus pseudokoreensis]|uniref:Flavin reductase family protein n=1 Tax=Rhodococcus pseudokoreensis TaxID=2811421 RepID=A0A974W4K8_9NOCA|nr:flavin reductase family protein [Rhodococcus pseudokoreensis]QSE90532.1 flavin reductase family protein [Rhodococcus pseudokoreensis]